MERKFRKQRPKKKPVMAESKRIIVTGQTVGPVLVEIDGKKYRSFDTVCECGHWASTHRGVANENTCEGFRCGCYTFRPLKGPTDEARSPRCAVCNVAITAKIAVLDERGTMLTTTWVHEGQEGRTNHTSSMPLPVSVGHGEWCSPGDCRCGLGVNWQPGDVVPEGAGRVMSEPKIRRPGMRISTPNPVPKPEPKKPKFPTVDEYEFELAQIRAERNKPQRAPREDEGFV